MIDVFDTFTKLKTTTHEKVGDDINTETTSSDCVPVKLQTTMFRLYLLNIILNQLIIEFVLSDKVPYCYCTV